jgi:hypothetical protein
MLGLSDGFWVSQLVFVAAKLGVADLLAKGPLTVEALAKRAGAHAPFLRRVMRALASVGVFAEDAAGRFRLTPLAQTLRSDRAGSLRDYVLMITDDHNWQAWGALEHAVRTGGSPFQHVHSTPFFAYLQRHPDKERAFAASMASISGTHNAALARAYPFGKLKQLVDVGGAHGHLLATILRRFPKLRGILYDQAQVGKLLDIAMMVLPGGQERTREEFRQLFARAGLRLQRVYATDCPLSVLEAVAA